MNAPSTALPEIAYSLSDYLAILKRRRSTLLWTALIILASAVGLALGLPPVYRSAATILIEQQEIPQDLVRSTVTTFADQRLQVIRQRVMTTTNLVAIINKYGLYVEDRKSVPIEQVVEAMVGDIEMETVNAEVIDPRTGKPGQATIAFTIAYRGATADLAQRVANELTSLYLNENLKTRTAMTADTSQFLSDEAAKLEARIADLESQLAAFKETNADSLPELTQLNLQLMDRTERELVESERELRSLQGRKIFLAAELVQLEPTVPAQVRPSLITDRGERVLEAKDRLKILRSQYLSSGSKYAPTHPDVIRLKREIAALENEVGGGSSVSALEKKHSALRGEVAAARERYSASHPDVRRLERQLEATKTELELAKATSPANRRKSQLDDEERQNPAYVQIGAQLEAANTDIRSLRVKQGALREKLANFEKRIASTPQVERSYRGLSRNYENAVAKYQEIRAKQMEAQLAESLESEQKGERFTLIEPPMLPEEPDSPNRLAIFLLGLVLSTAGGFGGAALAEAMDDTVRGRRGITAILRQPPLAVIPHIPTPGEVGGQYLKTVGWIGVLLALLAGAAALVHFFVIPLDVAWFAAMRRLGL